MKIYKIIRLVFPSYGLKNRDTLLASFPKSGNTWFRFIWLNMVSLMEHEGEFVTFHSLMYKYPATFEKNNFAKDPYHSLPRLVKTHLPFLPVFRNYHSILLIRNPKDVMVSYFHYINGLKAKRDFATIDEFVRDEKFGILAWCRHTQTWIGRATLIVSYESMLDDPIKVIKTVLDHLAITQIPDHIIQEAIQRSSFESVRQLEQTHGRAENDIALFNKGHLFTRRGGSQAWKDEMPLETARYVDQFVDNQLGGYPPEKSMLL